MTCRTLKVAHHVSSGSADIVTYRYNGELVYVPASPNYPVRPSLLSKFVSTDVFTRIQQALAHVRNAFPQLKHLRDASLSLSLTAPSQAQKCVGISALAWPKLVVHMARYQIIDVHATTERERQQDGAVAPVSIQIPSITITYADDVDVETEPAPPYPTSASDEKEREKASEPCQKNARPHPRSRTSSQATLHPWKRNWFLQKLQGNVFSTS